uniref:ribosomal protein S15 n=1 Tax=Paragymnopteris bipinnata var. bipinnata TaxID=2875816 RepID=UPI001F13AD47|nr:ribosomal protein S15 [Paragymnopteris bipinnata var. bipinnata]UAT96889.1 ribosomal protein S15 [Paragymnopteris bipinnata var. bipinnata]
MKKQESIDAQLSSGNRNTGFTASQIYYSTYQVAKLTSHLELHPKDYSSQLGLWKLLGKRRRLLIYLSNANTGLYLKVLNKLGIRGLKGR